MNNTPDDKEREEEALDALIASAFTEELCDVEDDDLDRFADALTDADRAKLNERGGPEFIKSLFGGAAKTHKKEMRGELATAMNRSEEDMPPTDKAQEEIERNIREAEEKRKAMEAGEEDGGDDGR